MARPENKEYAAVQSTKALGKAVVDMRHKDEPIVDPSRAVLAQKARR